MLKIATPCEWKIIDRIFHYYRSKTCLNILSYLCLTVLPPPDLGETALVGLRPAPALVELGDTT